MAAIVGLLNSRGKKARASNTILARVAVCLLAGLREQTEDPAYEEGVLEVPLVVGFPVLGHALLPPSTTISSDLLKSKGLVFNDEMYERSPVPHNEHVPIMHTA